jgi:hypothetical protein
MTMTERDYWLGRYETAVANAAAAAGERSRAAYVDLAHHYWAMHMMVVGRPTSTPVPQAMAPADAPLIRWAA